MLYLEHQIPEIWFILCYIKNIIYLKSGLFCAIFRTSAVPGIGLGVAKLLMEVELSPDWSTGSPAPAAEDGPLCCCPVLEQTK